MRGVLRRITVGCAVLMVLGAIPSQAMAAPECVRTPFGIQCSASGSTGSTQTSTRPGVTRPSLPPLRYLATAVDAVVGPCWYWSRYGPGYDSWDPARDQAIIFTRTFTPRCPDRRPTPPVSTTTVIRLAWEVLRSFPLPPPTPSITPSPSGFTGIPSRLVVAPAPSFHHDERLPDGTTLRVRAQVAAVSVRWGDGSPALRYPPAGAKEHTYGRKTCPPAYRIGHPSGGLCHPTLDAYPVDVGLVWVGEYFRAGRWTVLGEIERTTVIRHDVDEIIGVPQR